MSRLLDKLRSLEAETPKETKTLPPNREPYFHREAFPLSLFQGLAEVNSEVLREIYGISFPHPGQKEQFLFLDTETTGLAGGAGTVAFQIGAGYFERNFFVVDQYLIHHYGEEEQMLHSLEKLMRRFPVLVSFNGKTFDVPLLRSRFVMCRLDQASIPSVHADVLYPSRRLWKLRLHSCTLGRLEEELLGVSRDEDLPGALVPQTYFRYLQDGDFSPLLRILEHNRQDIVSLAQLFFFICHYWQHPEEIEHSADLFSLSGEMKRRCNPCREKKCYRLLAGSAYRPQAFMGLAEGEKHSGNYPAAIRLYQAMVSRGDLPVDACIALAKLYEHRMRDPRAALAYTRKALMLLSSPGLTDDPLLQSKRDELRKRYRRLWLKTNNTVPKNKEDHS